MPGVDGAHHALGFSADTACFLGHIPSLDTNWRDAPMDQYTMVTTITAVYLWSIMCIGIWLTYTSFFSTYELHW